jgi:aspartate kinase
MISTSEVAVSVTIDDDRNLDTLVAELQRFGTITVDRNQSIICVVGNRLAEREGVLNEVFAALEKVPVRMVSFGGSANNISILVEAAQKERSLRLLNEGLFHLGD